MVRVFKNIFNTIITSILILIFIGSIFGITFVINNKNEIENLKSVAEQKVQSINKGTFLSKMPTDIYDKDGNLLKEFSSYQYQYLKKNEIPDNFKNAFISIEDSRFREHNGIDLKSMTRAAISVIKNKGKKTQGGSTITQQLIKNVLLTNEKSYKRKIEEIFIALYLEKLYSKDEILEFYLNNIYFGYNSYGIESASVEYFNKHANNLNLSEIAFLCAIPNNPSMFDPYQNIENTYERRDIILSKMLENNYITDEEYQNAVDYKIVLNNGDVTLSSNYEPDTYLVSYAVYCAAREVMREDGFKFQTKFENDEQRNEYFNNYTEKYKTAEKKIREGGYKIYTSLDQDKQNILQNALDKNLSNFQEVDKSSGLYKVQGGAVCVDNLTGEVVAIVGGRNQYDVENTFNRGYLAVRQPGSAIKPLVAYIPAMELQGYNANSYMEDSYVKDGPLNSNRSYQGTVTMRYAVETSINTIPYKLVKNLGVQNCLDYLQRLNFKYVTPSDISPIVAVGGFTKGVTPEEMAGAYSTIARNGDYIATTCLTKIEKYDDQTLYVNNQDKVKVFTNDSSNTMTDIMKGVISKSYGTAHNTKLDGGRECAGKTGTTDSSKDAWMCGFTNQYTLIVYVGADIPEPINKLYGGNVPGTIWKEAMDGIHNGLEYKSLI